MAFNSIELCAGVGMLGESVRAAFAHLGVEHRTVCYVEREAPAASQLVTLMEAGALDPAPVWSDMLTFDGAAWRDCVYLVIACDMVDESRTHQLRQVGNGVVPLQAAAAFAGLLRQAGIA